MLRKNLFACTFMTLLLLIGVNTAKSQEGDEKIEELKGRVEGIDERLLEAQSDLSGLKKIKISGYLQVEFLKTENATGFLMSPYDSTEKTLSNFRIRRGRVKFNYDAGMTQFVIQGDFTNTGFALKDAYLDIIDPWTKLFTFRAGVFNRPNYEVEYSSSVRESMERSLIIRTLYLNERDLGAMLTFADDNLFTLQLAAFNNTFRGPVAQTQNTFREFPVYYMARITKSFQIMDDLSIDLGAHTRMGNIESNTNKFLESNQPSKDSNTVATAKGESFSRTWFGGEMQIYYDFFGGMKILAEYITGSDVNEPGVSGKSTNGATIRKRDFSGYYVMLVKNIGTDFQFAVKYDNYTPNTALDEEKIDVTGELATNTIGLGLHNFTFSNVRLSVWYDMIKRVNNKTFEEAGNTKAPVNNLLTVRFQYKF